MGLFGGDASASVTVESNALGVTAQVTPADLASCACCRALIFQVRGGWVHFDGLGHCYVHPSCGGKCGGQHGYAHPFSPEAEPKQCHCPDLCFNSIEGCLCDCPVHQKVL